jgi:uncharacterized delta-60 repeat protein
VGATAGELSPVMEKMACRIARFVGLVMAVGLLLVGQAWAVGPAFELDETRGVVRLELAAYDGPAAKLAVLPDGRMLVVHTTLDGMSAVTRLLPDGRIDPSFGDGGRRWIEPEPQSPDDVTVWTAMVDREGRILLGGTLGPRRFAARLQPDGALDPSFGSGGFALDIIAGPGLTLLPDGAILTIGYVHTGAQYDLAFGRLTPTGAIDRTFGQLGSKTLTLTGPDGTARLENLTVSAVLPDGRLLLSGGLSRLEGGSETALARLTPSGDLDPTFGTGGLVLGGWDHVGQPDAFHALVLLPDGRFIVQGGTTTDQFVARYDSNGRRDPDWGSSMPADGFRGDGRIDWSSSMVPHGDGWLIPGKSDVLGRSVPALMRLTADGRPDPSFGYRSTRLFDLDPTMTQTGVGLATAPGGGLVLMASIHPANRRGADLLIGRLRVPPHRSGYWMLGEDGKVYEFGEARHYGNGLYDRPQVDLEPTPSGKGYWILATDGSIGAFGDARHWGSPTYGALGKEKAASLSATPSGNGYWIFTDAGRVYPFGDATSFGDLSATRLNAGVLDSVATPSGRGYYMVASDGGIFAFGDAAFRGSMGGRRLNAPVQSLVPDGDGEGYWLVASDGGIFAFDAPFRGSMGGTKLNKPVTGMVRFGNGYLMVGSDGGIFNFSDRAFFGSLGDRPPARPVAAVAALET